MLVSSTLLNQSSSAICADISIVLALCPGMGRHPHPRTSFASFSAFSAVPRTLCPFTRRLFTL
ncbi:hypothetical protein PUN28_006204 [Cardiocondyla obscurior]|uniref:Uncharacterized protein n=1 Tax=Cardiocondyla obscurior TaxID=286306 RepID=A0AAW2G7L8_9HYME